MTEQDWLIVSTFFLACRLCWAMVYAAVSGHPHHLCSSFCHMLLFVFYGLSFMWIIEIKVLLQVPHLRLTPPPERAVSCEPVEAARPPHMPAGVLLYTLNWPLARPCWQVWGIVAMVTGWERTLMYTWSELFRTVGLGKGPVTDRSPLFSGMFSSALSATRITLAEFYYVTKLTYSETFLLTTAPFSVRVQLGSWVLASGPSRHSPEFFFSRSSEISCCFVEGTERKKLHSIRLQAFSGSERELCRPVWLAHATDFIFFCATFYKRPANGLQRSRLQGLIEF